MNYTEQLVLFLIALAANWFSALAGGGAGLVQLPVLIFLGLPFPLALATHKIATVALGLGATVRHLREKHLERWLLALIVLAGVPGVVGGALFILGVDARKAEIALGLLTLSLAVYSWVKPELGIVRQDKHRTSTGVLIGGLVLLLIGFANGALSAGSGLFVTLWLVYWFGLDYKTAVAQTLVAVGLGWNGAGAITMGTAAEVQWDWIPALILGSLLGGYLGANTSVKSGNHTIKRLFEAITLIVGLKLLLGPLL
ncbi:sulfite exporter TauE/SafE family protein [Thalassolituus sp. LLYu03]|uniref:sulfite exporter TauE/SafE family protein n=1 Tax=Thalassolituus sp. LLYu03 TaxID=3421656 RepID=UPI003D2B61A5